MHLSPALLILTIDYLNYDVWDRPLTHESWVIFCHCQCQQFYCQFNLDGFGKTNIKWIVENAWALSMSTVVCNHLQVRMSFWFIFPGMHFSQAIALTQSLVRHVKTAHVVYNEQVGKEWMPLYRYCNSLPDLYLTKRYCWFMYLESFEQWSDSGLASWRISSHVRLGLSEIEAHWDLQPTTHSTQVLVSGDSRLTLSLEPMTLSMSCVPNAICYL